MGAATVQELLEAMPLAPLGPGSPLEAMREKLRGLDAPATVRAGLWLAFGFLDESHALSQEIDTPEGSWWHAIMHRREGDFSNAKYWYRRVGEHPAFAALGWQPTDALAFVDRCERASREGGAEEQAARQAQQAEWQALLDWCREPASARSPAS